MSATSSLTKACFAFVPKSHKPRALDGRRCFEDCADEAGLPSAAARSNSFDTIWASAEALCSELQETMYNTMFADMITFLKRSGSLQENDCVPTAVLVTGVNMPDHGGVFASLASHLRSHVSRHVAVLESATCHTVAAAVRSMVQQLTAENQASDAVASAPLYDEDDDEQLVTAEPEKRKSRLAATLPGLVAHYEAAVLADTSSSEGTHQKRARLERPPLLVVCKELEAFNPKVLQDLVLICSQYRRHLPITFVFGVSTSASEVHRLLAQHVSARLSLSRFHSLLATHYLTDVIDKVVLSPQVPFRLGGRALRLLLDIFLYNDFSVNNFMSAYKYCMLHHFLTSPASVLCCPRAEIATTVAALTVAQLAPLRAVASVKTALKNEEARDDEAFKSWLEEAAHALHAKHDDLVLGLRCLWALTSRLPGSPLGKQFRELYNTALLHSLGDRDEYMQCVRVLGMLSRDELVATLEAALRVISELSATCELTCCLKRHLKSVRKLDIGPVQQTPEEASRHREQVQKQLKQASSRAALKESLQTMGAAQNKRQNPYESLRSSVVADIDERLRRLITRPATWPLHEAVVFDSATAVKRHLVGAPRISLQMALADPARYLECECCQLEQPSSVLASMPDICLVYKLHLECGRLINLYDWLQAFKSVVAGDVDDQTLQARFTDAVTQLQYLGFIKSTQRKTDHVARLTWGSC